MKLLGISLLLVSGAAFALMWRGRLDASLGNAEALCELLRFVIECVDDLSLSSSMILSRCRPELLRACGYTSDIVPTDFSLLAERCEITDGECRRIFEEFCAEFGRYYHAEQVRRCESCLRSLSSRASQIRSALPAQKKTGTALSLAAALMLAIMLA